MQERQPRVAAPRKTWTARLGQLADALVYALSPERGARRMATRMRMDLARDRADRVAYEGAESTQLRDGKWLGSRLSADSDLELDLETLRQRSRELYRNDSTGGAIESRVTHVVGCGFRPQAKIKAREGLVTAEQAKAANKQLEELYARWSLQADRDGRRSLWQTLRLAERLHAVDGECFVVMSDVGTADKPIPLALEVVDTDRVETPPQKTNDKLVRLGIEKDDSGKIVAYWIRRTHPNDTKDVDQKYDRVDASRVIHVFEAWFAGQSRGLPWLTRTLNRLKDAKDLDEAAIIAAQIEACFVGVVQQGFSPEQAARGAASATSNGKRFEDLHPGTLTYMADEGQVTFGQPQRASGAYAQFQEWNYRRTAAAIDWPYEWLMKDYRGLSFAGGRLVLTDGKLTTKVFQQLLTEIMLCRIWWRLVDEAVILGEVEIDPVAYFSAPWVFQAHRWIPPAWPYAITPGEEINADNDEVEANLATKADKLAARGLDLEEVLEQRAYEIELERSTGTTPAEKAAAAAPPAMPPTAKDREDQEREETLLAV